MAGDFHFFNSMVFCQNMKLYEGRCNTRTSSIIIKFKYETITPKTKIDTIYIHMLHVRIGVSNSFVWWSYPTALQKVGVISWYLKYCSLGHPGSSSTINSCKDAIWCRCDFKPPENKETMHCYVVCVLCSLLISTFQPFICTGFSLWHSLHDRSWYFYFNYTWVHITMHDIMNVNANI